jgi:hypothetical protein
MMGTILIKYYWFLVNFYGFTEAIAQSDGFGAAPSIIPYKSTKNHIILLLQIYKVQSS